MIFVRIYMYMYTCDSTITCGSTLLSCSFMNNNNIIINVISIIIITTTTNSLIYSVDRIK